MEIIMIKHVVMWKIKQDTNKNNVIQQIKNALDELPQKINEIIEFNVGINIISSDRAYDLTLVSLFKSVETLKAYQEHPDHKIVGKLIKKHTLAAAVVDYEIT